MLMVMNLWNVNDVFWCTVEAKYPEDNPNFFSVNHIINLLIPFVVL